MPHLRMPDLKFVTRGAAVALGLLLIPMTFSSNGLEENLACGSEGPDADCSRSIGSVCWVDGEYVQNWRSVE